MKLDYCATGTVDGKPWYTDGSLMVVGKPTQQPQKTGIVMDSVYKAATDKLKAIVAILKDNKTFAHPVYRTVPSMQLIQPKYRNLAERRKWKLFIGGPYPANPYNGERYIVAKQRGKIVAIIAPMRKP